MTIHAQYAVGYGRPPKASQFQKGQSGNPAGRKKGSRSISEVIAKALSERVSVTMDGRRKKITKWEAACTQMANKAAAGDAKTAKQMIDILYQSEAREDARQAGAPLDAQERRESDQLILAAVRGLAKIHLTEGGANE